MTDVHLISFVDRSCSLETHKMLNHYIHTVTPHTRLAQAWYACWAVSLCTCEGRWVQRQRLPGRLAVGTVYVNTVCENLKKSELMVDSTQFQTWRFPDSGGSSRGVEGGYR